MNCRGVIYSLILLFFLAIYTAPIQAAETPEIVCVKCHAALPGKLGEPVKLWRDSIHAENGIACNNCHGGDPKDTVNAMSPMRGFLGAPKETDIPAFCGRCHVGVLKNYQASPHGKALGKGGPTCVTCHGNHLIVKASLDLINEKSCSRCHGFERAKAIKGVMRQTESLILDIDGRINAFKGRGADTDRLEKGLFAVRNRFHSLFHEVDTNKVGSESTQIIDELNKLAQDLDGIDESRGKRKIIGAIVVAGALFAALLLYMLKKTYD